MLKNKYYMKLCAFVLVAVSILVIDNLAKISFAQEKKQIKEESPKVVTRDDTWPIIQYYKKGENDLTIDLAKKYLMSNPNNTTIINILAEAYINKHDLSAAEETLKRAMTIQPNDPWSCRLSARIYRNKVETVPLVKANNLTLALEQVEKGLVFSPDDVMLLAEAAEIYSQQGDNNKANRSIDRALTIAPDNTYLKSVKETINRVSIKK